MQTAEIMNHSGDEGLVQAKTYILYNIYYKKKKNFIYPTMQNLSKIYTVSR